MSDLFGAPVPKDPEPLIGADDGLSTHDQDISSSAKVEPINPFGDRGLWPEYANPFLLGMDDTQKQLLDMWRSGKFPHALSLAGAKGIGKATLAFHLARFVLDQSAETTDNMFADQDALFGEGDAPVETLALSTETRTYRQVMSGGHPDILTIGDFYKQGEDTDAEYTPAVDDIRRVPAFLQKTSAYGGWRVVIVDNADRMNMNAQNAILKVLEEPPSKALLILIVHREGAMLPTIKSRIRTLKCDPLPADVIKELMFKDNESLDHDDADLLAVMANGSAGRALSYAREDGVGTMPEVLGFLAGLQDIKKSDMLAFCEVLAQKNNASKLTLWRRIIIWLVETVIAAKARDYDPFATMDMSGQLSLKMAMQNFVAKGSVQDWLNVLEQLKDHFYECDGRNLDAFHEVYTALTILKDNVLSQK